MSYTIRMGDLIFASNIPEFFIGRWAGKQVSFFTQGVKLAIAYQPPFRLDGEPEYDQPSEVTLELMVTSPIISVWRLTVTDYRMRALFDPKGDFQIAPSLQMKLYMAELEKDHADEIGRTSGRRI